ncbi:MAG: GntR family transcriptional regulator [Verrucomicrobiota bacterium]|jgi:GntR family transcriptional regulator|nr:GntR family transcriptional regulator [Verrucomicrobiota bacterium]MDD8051141.1 GntR family transcriptional regulator [Verrucomicrobiota bacterium]MDI9382797.1 GntR family transcriptional regulator [Verrucomicrobiota bacterium]HCF96373.1 hypothetical protein [Verrucomicrobiota bacterium]
MFIRIEKGAAVPISRQIAEQIRAQCLAGQLEPGARLPSVRQLAHELAVNQNTILRVYERLAAENLLEMRHGEGTFVSASLPLHELATQKMKFAEEITRLIRQGFMLGFSRGDLRTMIDDALDSPETKTSSAGVRYD